MSGGINKLPLWENKCVTFSSEQRIVIFCEILRSLRYVHCTKESLEDTSHLFDLAKDAFGSEYYEYLHDLMWTEQSVGNVFIIGTPNLLLIIFFS